MDSPHQVVGSVRQGRLPLSAFRAPAAPQLHGRAAFREQLLAEAAGIAAAEEAEVVRLVAAARRSGVSAAAVGSMLDAERRAKEELKRSARARPLPPLARGHRTAVAPTWHPCHLAGFQAAVKLRALRRSTTTLPCRGHRRLVSRAPTPCGLLLAGRCCHS